MVMLITGEIYRNRNGTDYLYLGDTGKGDDMFAQLPINNGKCWTFIAWGLQENPDGTIEWLSSSDCKWMTEEEIDDILKDDDSHEDYPDEWDDYWADAARSVGAVPYMFL